MEAAERFAYVLRTMDSPQEGTDSPDDSLVLRLPDESSSPRDMALWAGMLALLVLIVYWPATDGQFIWLDARNLQPTDLSTIWAGRWQDASHYPMLQYHPVTYTTYWIENHLIGRDTTGAPPAFPYHLVNLLLHCGVAIITWLILRKLKLPGAWVAAALFAVHPLNAETVSWVSQRASVLAGLLFLGSIYSYLIFADDEQKMQPEQRWSLYGLSLGLFILAMLSKSIAWAMPVCTLLLLWQQRKISLRHVALLFPFLLIAVVLAFTAADFERQVAKDMGTDWNWTFGQRLIVAGQTTLFYLGKIVAPFRLSALYPKWPIAVGSLWPLLLIVAAGAGIVWRFGRATIVAAGCFVCCLLPAMGFVNLSPMQYSLAADHYAYLAVLPFVALVIAAAVQLLRGVVGQRFYVKTMVTFSAILLLAAGSLSWARTGIFQNSVVLLQDAVAKDPDSWFAHARLSAALREQADADLAAGDKETSDQDLKLALAQAQSAAALNPGDAQVQLIWGGILVRQNDPTGAIDHLREAVQIDPSLAEAHQELATVLLSLKQFQSAIVPLDAALALDSQSSSIHRMLGEAYEGIGDAKRAAAEDKEAIRLDPQNFKAHTQLANLLAKAGDTRGAITQMIIVSELRPNDPEVWNALGLLSGRTGRLEEMKLAVQFFKHAVDLDPTYTEAKKNLDTATGLIEEHERQATTQPATLPTK
jgi:tetratricopeptide (TPR) repeat protein